MQLKKIFFRVFIGFIVFTSGQNLIAQESISTLLKEKDGLIDSLLKVYTIDELVQIREYYRKEAEKVIQEKDWIRRKGIRDMENFIRTHPNSAVLDRVLIRLAELYYEQAIIDFTQANEEYNRLLELHDQGKIQELPEEPKKDFSRAFSLYQQIIEEFPNSPLVDDALYNKGFLYEELGEYDQAFAVYKTLINRYPESRYVPEALMRMAEYYFNPPINELETAIALYKQVLKYRASPRYDAALYRLGWAYYRLSDYPSAIAYFTILADDIDRARELDPAYKYHFPLVRDEAVEYIGFSFLDYGGPNLAARYFNDIGGRTYGFEVLKKIGDVYMDVKEEYSKAIEAYQLLLKLYPESEEAPKIQAKIAEAYRKVEDEQMAYVRRAELYKKYKKGSEWWKKVKDPEAKEEATNLAEIALRDNINLLLKKGEETGDQKFYIQAVNDSKEYLETFPDYPNAALIHWNMALTLDKKLGSYDEAFDEYIKISNLYWDTEYQRQAALNAIALADEAVRKDSLNLTPAAAFNIQELSRSDSLQNLLQTNTHALTPEEQRLAYALDNYIKLFPEEPQTAKILAKGGALYYERHQFHEAIKYFKTLVKHFPESSEVDYARYLVMESYFGKGDYESSEAVAKKLLASNSEYADNARRRLSESIFLRAKTFSDSLQHLKAAEEYKRVVTEVPDAEFADLALYNAALEYEQAKEYSQAINSYNELIQKYPQSEHYLVALNNMAFDYRELKDFANAGLTYEKLAGQHPDSQKAQEALYNASVSYVEAKDWEQAIRVNTLFVEKFPKAEEADDLLFDNAQYYLKLGNLDKANAIYADFAEKFPDSPRVVEAYYHRGMYFKNQGKLDLALDEFNNAVNRNKNLKKKGLETNDFYAAEALFELTEIKYQQFARIEFKLPPTSLEASKTKKKTLLKEIVDGYTTVAAFGTIRLYEATYKIGQAYEDFAKTWANQELPPMDDTRKIVAQKKINQTAAELYEKALEAYKKGYQVLDKLAKKYQETTSVRDTTETADNKIVPKDTTLIVAERWINKCKEKISETLFDIAQINYASVAQLLKAPPPAGIGKLEELVYRQQVIAKAVSPLITEIVTAHTRNLKEAGTLGLENKWVDLSKTKVVTTSNIIPAEFWKLSFEGLHYFEQLVPQFENSVKTQAETAVDLADQMANLLEISGSFAEAGINGYRNTLSKAQELAIESQEVSLTEQNLFQSIMAFYHQADSLAKAINNKRKAYEKLFGETQQPEYEDAMYTFDDSYNYLVENNEKILALGHKVSRDLQINNPWTQA
ncbi:MAG: outer membrane protein assembly factor BamD, partial [Calditrichaeota bacterium]